MERIGATWTSHGVMDRTLLGDRRDAASSAGPPRAVRRLTSAPCADQRDQHPWRLGRAGDAGSTRRVRPRRRRPWPSAVRPAGRDLFTVAEALLWRRSHPWPVFLAVAAASLQWPPLTNPPIPVCSTPSPAGRPQSQGVTALLVGYAARLPPPLARLRCSFAATSRPTPSDDRARLSPRRGRSAERIACFARAAGRADGRAGGGRAARTSRSPRDAMTWSPMVVQADGEGRCRQTIAVGTLETISAHRPRSPRCGGCWAAPRGRHRGGPAAGPNGRTPPRRGPRCRHGGSRPTCRALAARGRRRAGGLPYRAHVRKHATVVRVALGRGRGGDLTCATDGRARLPAPKVAGLGLVRDASARPSTAGR